MVETISISNESKVLIKIKILSLTLPCNISLPHKKYKIIKILFDVFFYILIYYWNQY